MQHSYNITTIEYLWKESKYVHESSFRPFSIVTVKTKETKLTQKSPSTSLKGLKNTRGSYGGSKLKWPLKWITLNETSKRNTRVSVVYQVSSNSIGESSPYTTASVCVLARRYVAERTILDQLRILCCFINRLFLYGSINQSVCFVSRFSLHRHTHTHTHMIWHLHFQEKAKIKRCTYSGMSCKGRMSCLRKIVTWIARQRWSYTNLGGFNVCLFISALPAYKMAHFSNSSSLISLIIIRFLISKFHTWNYENIKTK